MKPLSSLARLRTALPLVAVALVAAACGDSSTPTTLVSFAISDAPIGPLDEAVVTIDRITLNKPGDDVVIDEFPNDDPDGDPLDTITIDLLDYQGTDSILIVDGVEIEVGDYQNLRMTIIDEDTDFSWVVEAESTERKELMVPSDELKLGGFEVEDVGVQSFVIEFDLVRAMTYNPPPQDRYILTPRGVRIVDVAAAALVGGTVDPALFDGESPCDEKLDADEGNLVYLYAGHDLDPDALGDLFDPEIDEEAAANLEPPVAADPAEEDGTYGFSYLPPGDYTLAFSCDAEGDDPETDDGIVIPTPATEIREISLGAGDTLTCDFPVSGGDCF